MNRPKLSPKLKIFSTRQKGKSRSRRSPMQLVALRLHDLAILFTSRYGRAELPDDDSGRDDLAIAVNHLACLPHPQRAIEAWLDAWAPWLTLRERSQIVPPILANPRRYKADALAWRLRLTMEQRTVLGITTIGAIDKAKAERAKLRRQREIQRREASRRAKGAIPRRQYEQRSISRAKPWEAEGISRATWYRRQRETTIANSETTPPTA